MKKLLILVASLATLSLSLSQTAAAPNPLVIAHRGSSAQAPENTLPAFQLAWAQGAGIEADFQLTKDGHIVCFHDKDTERLAGRQLALAAATLEELRQFDVSFEKRANGKPRNAPARVIKTLRDIKALPLMSGGGEVDKDLLDRVRTAGIEHYVWTINDPNHAATYRTQGVDAIITDVPAEMRAALLAPVDHD